MQAFGNLVLKFVDMLARVVTLLEPNAANDFADIKALIEGIFGLV